jgi:hypothetical protein
MLKPSWIFALNVSTDFASKTLSFSQNSFALGKNPQIQHDVRKEGSEGGKLGWQENKSKK